MNRKVLKDTTQSHLIDNVPSTSVVVALEKLQLGFFEGVLGCQAKKSITIGKLLNTAKTIHKVRDDFQVVIVGIFIFLAA